MEFEKFPKIPRLNRDIIITEKIDGTNAQINIVEFSKELLRAAGHGIMAGAIYFSPSLDENTEIAVWAGSRNRWLNLVGGDNHGFAGWVFEHGAELIAGLGVGYHYGEWWGQGIQRCYGLDEKRFSLFNTKRWTPDVTPDCCHVVPVLYEGPWTGDDFVPASQLALNSLVLYGSRAAPGFMEPEGIVIFHAQGNVLFKATLEGDEEGKG